ncbi:hypothetical protein AB0P12_17955 [Streptomyces subrutilus]|uniref:hypothetical protein n=1 Tax=Streptomyces subrutilus TaxID=36818 RepID=UPI003446EDE6
MNIVFLLLVLLLLIGAAGWATSAVLLRVQRLERRVDRMDRRLGLILDHLGVVEPEPAGMDGVRALLRDDRTVEAVKAYRAATGADLVEAKAAVESMSGHA